MRAKIRHNAFVGQDHSFFRGQQDDTIFDVSKVGKSLYKCVANGYGDLSRNYGNGAIYVRHLKDLIPVDGGE